MLPMTKCSCVWKSLWLIVIFLLNILFGGNLSTSGPSQKKTYQVGSICHYISTYIRNFCLANLRIRVASVALLIHPLHVALRHGSQDGMGCLDIIFCKERSYSTSDPALVHPLGQFSPMTHLKSLVNGWLFPQVVWSMGQSVVPQVFEFVPEVGAPPVIICLYGTSIWYSYRPTKS